MRPSVANELNPFNDRFEGYIPWMYVDELGLVTVGRGNLIDPLPAALRLGWQLRQDDDPASLTEITMEWRKVKDMKRIATAGKTSYEVYLSKLAIDNLCLEQANENEAVFIHFFPAFHGYPADAQLGIHSMAWAAGAAVFAGFPKFTKACNGMDFLTASAECRLDDSHNKGLTPRNIANQQLFMNADCVVRTSADYDKLFWPQLLQE